MAEEKEEVEGTAKKGTDRAVVELVKELRGVVLICGEANTELIAAIKEIIQALIGKAKKGDIPSIKFLIELARKAGRAEEISDEEIETLGKMLMREFYAWQEEDCDQGPRDQEAGTKGPGIRGQEERVQ